MHKKRSIEGAFLDSKQPQKKRKSSDLNFSTPLSTKALPSSSLAYNRHQGTLPPLPEIGDVSLADVPFIHQGTLSGKAIDDAILSYDRLEFLGDAYLEVIASRLIFNRYPTWTVGKLSQKRESLVRNDTLAQFSMAYGFDKRARLPKSIQMAGSQDQSKIWIKTMGDIFEAYVAAVINSDPENGFSIVERWMTELWAPALSIENDVRVDPDAKVQLAKKIGGKAVKIAYVDEAQPGVFKKEGKILFQVGVFVTGWGWQNAHLGSGSGWNKSEAGNGAAMEAITNPLTAQIASLKRDFDLKVAEERKRTGSLANSSKTE